MPTPKRIATPTVLDAAGYPIAGSFSFLLTNLVLTAAAASSAAIVVPAGSFVFQVSTQGPIGLKFGTSGVAAAALDNTTLLLPAAGTYLIEVPATVTHLTHIRAGAADAIFQISAVPTQT